MKNKPKLQDTLEVFLEQLETVHESMKGVKAVDKILQDKIVRIQNMRIEPDMSELKRLHYKFHEETTKSIKEVNNLFANYVKRTTEITEKQKQNNAGFYKYIFLFFIVTSAAVYFGIRGQFKQSEIKDQLEKAQSYSQSLETYIKESKQVEKYNKWLRENSK